MQDFENCLGLQIKLTQNIMANEYNKYLKDFGISSEQGLLLKFVHESPGCTQTQLSHILHKDKTTITRMIDTLEKKSKLYRENSSEDRRIFKIYLTPKSAKKVEEISPLFEQREQELEAIIPPKDYETTIRVLNQIKEYYRGLNR
ncbi:MAG: MarR family transcriptional regulator [Sulfurospirillum sp.]|nr:MarR family transcriptional regulator [Sulfurospirillum sp.]